MDYKKLHNETLQKLQEMVSEGKITEEVAKEICADFVAESEDEKIRKALIDFFNKGAENGEQTNGIYDKDILAWLEKQGEQKSAWSQEDENGLGDALWAIRQAGTIAKDENDMGNLWYAERWLKSLKQKQMATWKPSKKQIEALMKARYDTQGKEYHNILAKLHSDLIFLLDN